MKESRATPHGLGVLTHLGWTWPGRAVFAASPERAQPPQTARQVAGVSPELDAVQSHMTLVSGAYSGAGATTVALALAEAASATGRRTRLVEFAAPERSGLVAAATAELGNDEAGVWARGCRDELTLRRLIASDVSIHAGWLPELERLDDGLTVVDSGWSWPEVISSGSLVFKQLFPDTTVVLVARATVPGLRRLEHVLAGRGWPATATPVIACVGAPRWPKAVVAARGPLLRAAAEAGLVVRVPTDRDLEVLGITGDALPTALLRAGHALLTLTTTTPDTHDNR